jgi:hypothetical protein
MKVTYPRLWLKHWRVRQALVNYPLYDVPHKTRERDLPEAQVRENFAYFMRVRHKRLADFQSWLHGNFRYDASLDAAGAEQLSRWIDEYGGGVIDDEPGSMSIFESYSPTWVDRYAGYNTMIDLGIFMGEFIILKRPKLFWEIYQGHEIEPATFESAGYQRPIIGGLPRGWKKDVLTLGYGSIANSHEASKIGHNRISYGPTRIIPHLKSTLYAARLPDGTDPLVIGDSRNEQL